MNEFYPEISPFNDFLLNVDHQHQVYVEQCGNPDGQPVLFIHGGPGGGASNNDRRFFDPEKYHIILFDQRGCGRSLPHGCLDNNNTDTLVQDIEKIRTSKRPSTKENASSASIQREIRTKATTKMASNNIGATPKAASATRPSKPPTAIGACDLRNARAEGLETSKSSISWAKR